MSISATKTKNLTSSKGAVYPLTASFTENSTNTTNNTSNITCTATLKSNGGSWDSNYTSTIIIYWHDNRNNQDIQVASNTTKKLNAYALFTATGTINVTHNDDGTLSGYAKAVFTQGSSSGGWCPPSNNVSTDNTALTTIARASQPTLDKTTFNIGDTITINTNRKSTAFTHNVILYFGNYSYTIATGVTDQVTFNTSQIASNMYQQIPNAPEGEGNITLVTYNGSTQIGSKYSIFIAKVTNSSPTFNSAYLDTNATTTAITNNNQQIIRNNSTLQVNITNAQAKNYATLSSAKVNINGTNYTASFSGSSATFNIGTLNLSSNTTAVVSVTDSRGITTSQNLTLIILDWQLPTAIISLQRENNYYSETNINVNADYSSLDNKNTITIKVREKQTTSSTWSAYTTLQDEVTTQLTLDNNYAWDVQVLVEDAIGSTTYNLTLDRGIPIIYFDRLKRSMGINCFPANNSSFELDGDIYLNNNTLKATIVDMIYPVGSIYISVNNTSPQTLFGGTWEQIQDTFLMASGSTYTGGSTGGNATHNHLTPIGFDDNALYGYSTYQSGEYLPAYNSTVLKDVNRISLNIAKDTGNIRIAYTDNSSSIPPYLAVYVWKRTA